MKDTIGTGRSGNIPRNSFENVGSRNLSNHRLMFWAASALLLILAVVLRFYRLDGQIWLDEISALNGGYRKPFLYLLTTFPGYFPHPLYELMAHGSLVLFGDSSFAIRLPAAIFGALGVLMFFRLAWDLVEPGEAFLASLLFALSYHHIFFSQNARGYTVYLFLFLLSTYLLLKLLKNWRGRTAIVYALSMALTAYAQPFGLFVFAGHFAVALPVSWLERRRGDTRSPTVLQVLASALLTGLLILILYAPYIQDSVLYSRTISTTAGAGPRISQLIPEILEGLRAALGSWIIVAGAAIVGAVGALDFLRRWPLVVAALISPIVVAAFAAGFLGVGVHPRYFLIALPAAYLLGTHGFWIISRTVVERLLRLSAPYFDWVHLSLSVVVVLVAATPLLRYYSMPKQDFLGAIQFVQTEANETDRFVAADLAGHAIAAHYAPDYPVVDTLAELVDVEKSGKRVWVITTLERIMASRVPDLMDHLQTEYERVHFLPGTLGDGAMRIYVKNSGK